MVKAHMLGLLLLSMPCVGMAAEAAFDAHVHLWNGEESVREYVAQLESGGVDVQTGQSGCRRLIHSAHTHCGRFA